MLKVLMMKLCPARRYSSCNVAKNRVPKLIPKSFSKRLKSRAKSTVSTSMILSFVRDMDRVRVLMKGGSVTLLTAFIFGYSLNT